MFIMVMLLSSNRNLSGTGHRGMYVLNLAQTMATRTTHVFIEYVYTAIIREKFHEFFL